MTSVYDLEKYAAGRAIVEWPDGMSIADEEAVISVVAQHVIKANPELYSFAGKLVRIHRKSTHVWIETLTEEDKAALIKNTVYFHKGAAGDYKAVSYARVWFRYSVMNEVIERVQKCKGVVSYPIITPTGKIVAGRGYNAETGMYVDTSYSVKDLITSEEVSRNDIVNAQSILRKSYRHKAFYSEADVSRYVAVLLTAVMRCCYEVVPAMYTNDTSNDSGDASALFCELDAILMGRNATSKHLKAERYVGKHCDAQAVKNGKVIPVLLGWSRNNQTPQWPCTVDKSLLSNMVFSNKEDVIRLKLLSDFAFYRKNVFKALITLIRAWQQADRPAPKKTSTYDAQLDQWYEQVGGVLEYAGYPSICVGVGCDREQKST